MGLPFPGGRLTTIITTNSKASATRGTSLVWPLAFSAFCERTSENSSSRDCLESPYGHQTGATETNIEGQGDRIFALQANDLASLTPLQPTFQTVSLRRSVNRGKGMSRYHGAVPSAAEEQEVMEARQTEVVITATSPEGFAEAIREGLARATASLRGVQGVEIRDQKMIFEGGSIVGYQVNLAVTFDLDPESVREELGVVLDPEEYQRLSEAEEELEDLRAYDDAVMELRTGEDMLTHWEDARVRIEAERAELRRRGEL